MDSKHWRVQVPFIGCAFGALSGAMFALNPWVSLLLGCLALWGSPRRVSWWLAVLGVALVVGWGDASSRDSVEKVRSFAEEGYSEKRVQGVLQVGKVSSHAGKQRRAQFSLEDHEIGVVVERGWDLELGGIYQVEGSLFLSAQSRNPGVISQRERWAQQNITAGLMIDHAEKIADRFDAPFFRLAEHLRAWISQTITLGLANDERARTIILAMVLGEVPPRSSEITEAFRLSGCLHVFAVSGLHVNVIGALCWLVLMVVGVSRRRAMMGVIFVMVLYAVITGARPPAVRAALMGSFFLSAFLFRRRPSLFNTLALSLIIVLLMQPEKIHELGFQLSYGVFLGWSFQ